MSSRHGFMITHILTFNHLIEAIEQASTRCLSFDADDMTEENAARLEAAAKWIRETRAVIDTHEAKESERRRAPNVLAGWVSVGEPPNRETEA
jgi:hypothetical protein